ncbi:MAG: hypothetical protein V4723_18500 [Pseudomonadota bacterium]
MRHFLIATTALLLASATLAAEPEKFTIPHDEAALGSRLKTSRFTLNVPPDKNYADLTEAQKNLVKANYENLGPDDEPPYPVGGVLTLYKTISDVGIYWKAVGEIELIATVSPEGNVTAVSAFKTPDIRMTEYAAKILAVQKFKPAMCKGVPCVMDFPLKLNLRTKRG